ncbi:hypothetical protein BH23ACT11_BH23ACT11_19060 [soil metagenome]
MNSVSMLRIELRRSVGFLAFPVLLAVAFAMGWAYTSLGFDVWLDTSIAIRSSVLLVGPLIGGLSAWVAIRNKRRGIQEMLAIAPRSPVVRDLTTWAGTALWGVLAYLLFAGVMLALTYPNATWGTPLPGFILVGLLAVFAASASGFAAGYYLPSRFTAPVVAVVIFMAQGTTADMQNYSLLSPTPSPLLNLSVFYEVTQVALSQSLLFGSLSGIALALVVVKNWRHGFLPWFALVFFCAIGTIGAVMSVEASPRVYDDGSFESFVPYEPVCEEGRIIVCVHPAYEASLPEVANNINELAEPLAGLVGSPTHALQSNEFAYPKKYRKNAVTFYEGVSGGEWSDFGAQNLAYELVAGQGVGDGYEEGRMLCESNFGKSEYYPPEEAKGIVADGLTMRIGAYSEEMPVAECRSSEKRVKRFAALDPAGQRVWLRENFADLRAGKLTPEDLP